MRVAIIDDAEDEIKAVKAHLARAYRDETKPEIFGFSSVSEYDAFVQKSKVPFDVMFLDIMLDGQNGITLAENMIRQNDGMLLVFMSADVSFFRDVYKVRHTYFLTKPIDDYYFDDCIRRIKSQLATRKLVLEIGGEKQVIDLQTVLYFESALRKTIVHFRGGTELCVNRRMSELENALHSPSFVRVHKSFIVNLDAVSGIERSSVLFPDNVRVSVSRPYIKSFREKTATYFNGIL